MMVASNCVGAVSHPICLDDVGLELLDTMGEQRARIKKAGHSDEAVPEPCLYPMISAAIFALTCQSGPLISILYSHVA
jgi:hypothetical protein